MPNYAGSHATGWAILQGEKKHGVTWHAMTDTIDGGDIILGHQFYLAENETSFGLNLKCFDAALRSLRQLLTLLNSRSFCQKPQDKTIRASFYYQSTKPKNNGIITSEMPLVQINRLLNAAYFNYIDNDFYTAKIQFGPHFYFVLEANCHHCAHSETPGTIHKITNTAITVAYKGGYLEITKLTNTLKTINISILSSDLGLRAGTTLPHTSPLDLLGYKRMAESNHRQEKNIILFMRKNPPRWFDAGLASDQQLSSRSTVLSSFSTKLTEAAFVASCYECMFDYFGFFIPIQSELHLSQITNTAPFLKHSFILIDSKQQSQPNNLSNTIKQQLTALPYIQSDIAWRYNGLDSSILAPPLLISLQAEPSLTSHVIFNYYRGKARILINDKVVISSKLQSLFVDIENKILPQTEG